MQEGSGSFDAACQEVMWELSIVGELDEPAYALAQLRELRGMKSCRQPGRVVMGKLVGPVSPGYLLVVEPGGDLLFREQRLVPWSTCSLYLFQPGFQLPDLSVLLLQLFSPVRPPCRLMLLLHKNPTGEILGFSKEIALNSLQGSHMSIQPSILREQSLVGVVGYLAHGVQEHVDPFARQLLFGAHVSFERWGSGERSSCHSGGRRCAMVGQRPFHLSKICRKAALAAPSITPIVLIFGS